jgi:hypothetical protein
MEEASGAVTMAEVMVAVTMVADGVMAAIIAE